MNIELILSTLLRSIPIAKIRKISRDTSKQVSTTKSKEITHAFTTSFMKIFVMFYIKRKATSKASGDDTLSILKCSFDSFASDGLTAAFARTRENNTTDQSLSKANHSQIRGRFDQVVSSPARNIFLEVSAVVS